LSYAEKCKKNAEEEGKKFTCVSGDRRLIRGLLKPENGWDSEEFLIVEPGQKIVPVYDWDEVIKAAEDK